MFGWGLPLVFVSSCWFTIGIGMEHLLSWLWHLMPQFLLKCVPQPLRYPFLNIHSLLLALVSKICHDSFLCRHDLQGVWRRTVFFLTDVWIFCQVCRESYGWLVGEGPSYPGDNAVLVCPGDSDSRAHTHARMCFSWLPSLVFGWPAGGTGGFVSVCVAPFVVSLREPSMKVPMIEVSEGRHHGADWGKGPRTIPSQPQHMNKVRSVCVHACVLRSRCAATFPISSAWIGAHNAVSVFIFPLYVSGCGLHVPETLLHHPTIRGQGDTA